MAKHELISILKQPKVQDELVVGDMANDISTHLGIEQHEAVQLVDRAIQIAKRNKIDILSDQPTSTDTLGIQALVQTLSEIIVSETTQTPITISLHGQWGTGKTSILKMIEKQLANIGYSSIWLNPWSLESTENLFTTVASEIQYDAEAKNRPKKIINDLAKKAAEWATQAIFTLSGTPALSTLSDLAGSIARTASVTKASLEREQTLVELASVATINRSFRELVDILLKDSGHKNPRLIVFVDDIDRALPDQISTILKNLKLVLEMPKCVFVLAMDTDIVARSLESYYRSHNRSSIEVIQEGFGYSYLEKLVQIRVEVPSLTREAVSDYLDRVGIVSEIKEIINWAPDKEVLNPRRLKAYINWLSVSLRLIMSTPIPSQIDNLTALRSMMLNRNYPEIYQDILNPAIVYKISKNSIYYLQSNYPIIYDYLINAGVNKLDLAALLSLLRDQYRNVYERLSDSITDRTRVDQEQIDKFLTEHYPEVYRSLDRFRDQFTIQDALLIFLRREYPDTYEHLLREVYLTKSIPEEEVTRLISILQRRYHISDSDLFDARYFTKDQLNAEFAKLLKKEYPEIYRYLIAIEYFLVQREPTDVDTVGKFNDYLKELSVDQVQKFDKFIRENPLLNASQK